MLLRVYKRNLIKFVANFMRSGVRVTPALVGEHDGVWTSII